MLKNKFALDDPDERKSISELLGSAGHTIKKFFSDLHVRLSELARFSSV